MSKTFVLTERLGDPYETLQTRPVFVSQDRDLVERVAARRKAGVEKMQRDFPTLFQPMIRALEMAPSLKSRVLTPSHLDPRVDPEAHQAADAWLAQHGYTDALARAAALSAIVAGMSYGRTGDTEYGDIFSAWEVDEVATEAA